MVQGSAKRLYLLKDNPDERFVKSHDRVKALVGEAFSNTHHQVLGKRQPEIPAATLVPPEDAKRFRHETRSDGWADVSDEDHELASKWCPDLAQPGNLREHCRIHVYGPPSIAPACAA
jgi:hypothetical protein